MIEWSGVGWTVKPPCLAPSSRAKTASRPAVPGAADPPAKAKAPSGAPSRGPERSALTESSERGSIGAVMMTDQESAFVEEMGQVLASYGMTPMAGRMWGWLLICDPPEQTAGAIADALHASRGAISGTARILSSAGFIRRSTRGRR